MFEGRERTTPLADGAAEVTLSLLEGKLRAVTEEQPHCLLRLSGPPPQLASLAGLIGTELRLSVPRGTLASAAWSLARAQELPPRRLGAPALIPGMSVSDAFAHVAGHLVDVLLHWAALAPRGDSPEPVHQMRVAVRRFRSALSVFRPAVGCAETEAAATTLRELGAQLSPARDWDVFLGGTGEAIRTALPGHKRVDLLLAAASRQRRSAYRALEEQIGASPFRQLVLQFALLAALRPWEAQAEAAQAEAQEADCAGFAAHALSRRLRRVLKAGDEIDGLATAELHELRKDAKRLRYACEFFAPLFGGRAGRKYIKRLTALQNELGLLNDGAAATGMIATLGRDMERGFAAGVVQGFIAARAIKARARVGRAWQRLRRQDPFWD
jgi:CHAD domain-containing protein